MKISGFCDVFLSLPPPYIPSPPPPYIPSPSLYTLPSPSLYPPLPPPYLLFPPPPRLIASHVTNTYIEVLPKRSPYPLSFSFFTATKLIVNYTYPYPIQRLDRLLCSTTHTIPYTVCSETRDMRNDAPHGNICCRQ